MIAWYLSSWTMEILQSELNNQLCVYLFPKTNPEVFSVKFALFEIMVQNSKYSPRNMFHTLLCFVLLWKLPGNYHRVYMVVFFYISWFTSAKWPCLQTWSFGWCKSRNVCCRMLDFVMKVWRTSAIFAKMSGVSRNSLVETALVPDNLPIFQELDKYIPSNM